jgi:hypothetical protein
MTQPTLALIGTGGTIAGAASAASSSTDYQPASLSLAAVVDTVPELRQRYAIEVTQPMQLASYDVRPEHWIDLHAAVMQAVNNPNVVGIVVTHGTDTLEETATFLHLSVDTHKPIVVVGAMRPATAYSADGPANLLDACSVAACPGARGRGTLVVMNGRIHSGLWVGKRHVSSVEAFDSPLAGAVGEVADQAVQWFRSAGRAPTVASRLASGGHRRGLCRGGRDRPARLCGRRGAGHRARRVWQRQHAHGLPRFHSVIACTRCVGGPLRPLHHRQRDACQRLRRCATRHLDRRPTATAQGAHRHAAGPGARHGWARDSNLD